MTSRLRDTGRAARTAFLGLSSVALGAALFAAPGLPAAADPPLTVAEARAQIAQLQEAGLVNSPADFYRLEDPCEAEELGKALFAVSEG